MQRLRHIFHILLLAAACLCAGSCVEEEQFNSTPKGNMEALWKIMDEHYCFFNEKKEKLGVDWNEVHERYRSAVSEKMGRTQLFEVLCRMLGELRDGHVNLFSAFDLGREWSWHENYPANYADTLQRKYLGTDYRVTNGLRYKRLEDNTGYIYCGSFENVFGEGNLDEVMFYLAPCTRLIIDIRNNGGGQLTSAQQLAARFTEKELTVGYMRHKTGKGHNDFSAPVKQTLVPSKGLRWQKSVYVLTNRSVYSAANEFVKYMKAIGQSRTDVKVLIIGDSTGGGGGMPFSSELPNGWGVRFSACPIFDKDMKSTESGIAPDVKVDITSDDFQKGIDTILETARNI